MISVIKSENCCGNFVIKSVKIDSSVRENVSLKDHLIHIVCCSEGEKFYLPTTNNDICYKIRKLLWKFRYKVGKD